MWSPFGLASYPWRFTVAGKQCLGGFLKQLALKKETLGWNGTHSAQQNVPLATPTQGAFET
jgi:hypothetical protein